MPPLLHRTTRFIRVVHQCRCRRAADHGRIERRCLIDFVDPVTEQQMRVAALAVPWRLQRIIAGEIACREMDAAVSAIFVREGSPVIFEVIEHMYRAMG